MAQMTYWETDISGKTAEAFKNLNDEARSGQFSKELAEFHDSLTSHEITK